ncbi:MAG: VOC family protein [Anaeromyxobacter sp.]
MAQAVKAIPDGYQALTPYLVCEGAEAAIAFYRKVFGAELLYPPIPAPGGRIGHAELRIWGAVLMLADASAEFRGPRAFGGSPVSLLLYVPDVDATVRAAVAAGARLLREVKDQFYGDRSGTLEDPLRARLDRRDARGGRTAGGAGAAHEGHAGVRAGGRRPGRACH